jgi:uncharacterized protein YjbI with pentapeptide repeats
MKQQRKETNTNPLMWNTASLTNKLLEQVAATNATLSGKKLLAKMLNEVKTANCFLSVWMPCYAIFTLPQTAQFI